ncbi:MAG: hypothetical protein A3F46_10540 [Legionellales bacterium RIFCSPHIGHO2_12_FULL_42_9]|nr:MAG: hypothetical protein A3F46_10540 [Legionellales bacterium RIFCSPHIGHO2_12_FULL_42_9]
MTKTKLSPVALGLALGVLWGASLLLLGLLTYFGYEGSVVASLRTMQVGYDFSILGSVIAGLIAFVDGFIRGAILAWLYNCFACCCCKKDAKCN